MEMMMMEQELEVVDINLLRDAQEYGCTCACPYEVYAAIEYGYTEN